MGFVIFSLILLFAGGGSSDGWWSKVDPYVNFPGFEFWRFLNLAIFVAILVKFLKQPLSEAFKARREAIRSELIQAEQEKQMALGQLATVEGKLVQLETERSEILAQAANEAASESARISAEAEAEVARIRSQAAGDLARRVQQIKKELRRFSAEESVRRAESKIKSQMDPATDAKLVKSGIQSIGGAR